LVFGNLIYDIVYSDHCRFSLDARYWILVGTVADPTQR